MARQHGGYRKPANPAPVSGPGAHSQRTDGKQPVMDLPDAGYGEGKAFREQQQGAAVPQTQPMAAPPGGGMSPLAGVLGLDAPSQQPGTPVTNGAQYGPGAGPGALGLDSGGNPDAADAQYLSKYRAYLLKIANSEDAPPSAKQYARRALALM